ncbi:MAG: hypothetical protein K0S25_1619 [Bacillus sp. (in: firmicutes)]|nr:hypothetical protein [Bacillus sp. (in: firmicutes)]
MGNECRITLGLALKGVSLFYGTSEILLKSINYCVGFVKSLIKEALIQIFLLNPIEKRNVLYYNKNL